MMERTIKVTRREKISVKSDIIRYSLFHFLVNSVYFSLGINIYNKEWSI